MKKVIIAVSLVAAVAVAALAGPAGTPQERYIAKYSPIAVNEMYRTGVPASITLAQGLIESGYGMSPLAINGNNHFGIKCHRGWTGRTLKADDDRRGECFRAYDSAEESFRDHSDFLRYRDRYKFLFDFNTTDYKSWAYGLKQAGYATDPSYASKLIKCIEDNDLTRFDRMTVSETLSAGDDEAVAPETAEGDVIPASPLKIEAGERVGGETGEQYRFSLTRQLYSRNGVPFVYAVEGETYRSIARDYHLFLKEILRFNDLPAEETLAPGTVVYVQAKKAKTRPGLEKYIVGSDGESFHAICQRFAVQEKAIAKLNGLSADYEPQEGDELLLRPAAKSRKFRKS